jgi:flagellar basal-body rod protein FlgF
MENGLVIALSHQGALRRHLDVIAHNVANMDTVGFKAQQMLFTQHLVQSRGGETVRGERLAFVQDLATLRDLSEGELKGTGNPLDVAIRGDGYFAVDTPEGERYTRGGKFRVDAVGQLVTEGGHPVLTEGGGPIVLANGDAHLTINRDGGVSTENGDLGRLRIVRFDNPQAMQIVAGGLLSSPEAPLPVAAPEVAQGMLEGSNVESVVEMTRMIEVQRAYDSARNLIDREDERIRNMIREYVR